MRKSLQDLAITLWPTWLRLLTGQTRIGSWLLNQARDLVSLPLLRLSPDMCDPAAGVPAEVWTPARRPVINCLGDAGRIPHQV